MTYTPCEHEKYPIKCTEKSCVEIQEAFRSGLHAGKEGLRCDVFPCNICDPEKKIHSTGLLHPVKKEEKCRIPHLDPDCKKCNQSPSQAKEEKCECGKFPLKFQHICYKGKLYPPLDQYCPICRINKRIEKMNICEECSNNGETLIQIEPSFPHPKTDWEEEFDRNFSETVDFDDWGSPYVWSKVKSFIRSLLSSAQQEGWEKTIKEFKNISAMATESIEEWKQVGREEERNRIRKMIFDKRGELMMKANGSDNKKYTVLISQVNGMDIIYKALDTDTK